MEHPIIDIGFSMNVVKATICYYGFWLFAWWAWREWKYKKHIPSTVYTCITFLLLGLAIDNSVEGYARYQWIHCQKDTIRYTVWWPLRLVPSTLVLFGLIWHLTMRAIHALAEEKNEQAKKKEQG